MVNGMDVLDCEVIPMKNVDLNSIFVMNQFTYDLLLEDVYEDASRSISPIDYIKLFSEIEVDIDNTLPNEIIEVYNVESYRGDNDE